MKYSFFALLSLTLFVTFQNCSAPVNPLAQQEIESCSDSEAPEVTSMRITDLGGQGSIGVNATYPPGSTLQFSVAGATAAGQFRIENGTGNVIGSEFGSSFQFTFNTSDSYLISFRDEEAGSSCSGLVANTTVVIQPEAGTGCIDLNESDFSLNCPQEANINEEFRCNVTRNASLLDFQDVRTINVNATATDPNSSGVIRVTATQVGSLSLEVVAEARNPDLCEQFPSVQADINIIDPVEPPPPPAPDALEEALRQTEFIGQNCPLMQSEPNCIGYMHVRVPADFHYRIWVERDDGGFNSLFGGCEVSTGEPTQAATGTWINREGKILYLAVAERCADINTSDEIRNLVDADNNTNTRIKKVILKGGDVASRRLSGRIIPTRWDGANNNIPCDIVFNENYKHFICYEAAFLTYKLENHDKVNVFTKSASRDEPVSHHCHVLDLEDGTITTSTTGESPDTSWLPNNGTVQFILFNTGSAGNCSLYNEHLAARDPREVVYIHTSLEAYQNFNPDDFEDVSPR